MGPVRQNPIKRTVRTAHLSVLMRKCTAITYHDCAQLHYTIQHEDDDVDNNNHRAMMQILKILKILQNRDFYEF